MHLIIIQFYGGPLYNMKTHRKLKSHGKLKSHSKLKSHGKLKLTANSNLKGNSSLKTSWSWIKDVMFIRGFLNYFALNVERNEKLLAKV